LILGANGNLAGTPFQAGTFNFTITSSNGVSPSASKSFSITVYPAAYRTWSSKYFNASQLADPTICGLAATPQNDGLSNLLKYLFDINPAQPMAATDRAALPIPGTQSIGGVPYLTLTYRKNSALSAVIVQVQSCTNLHNWITLLNPTVVQVGTDSTTGDPIMQVQVPASGTTGFLQLEVISP
jgi:hypothetical protein